MGHLLTNVFESTKAVTIFSNLKEKTGEYKYLSDSFDLFRIAKASLYMIFLNCGDDVFFDKFFGIER